MKITLKNNEVNGLAGIILSILVVAFVLAVFGIVFGAIYLTFYGLYLAFTSHIVTGIIVLLIEPLPAIIGAVQFFFDHNLANDITNFLLSL